MAEKLIGDLLSGDHLPPPEVPLLRERLKTPLAIGIPLLVIAVLLYTFINYREESTVRTFLYTVSVADNETAYAMWDAGERYRMKDFLIDWGEGGYYTNGPMKFDLCDSNSSGSAVIVYVRIDGRSPLAIMVDKATLLLSFSPSNKYREGGISRFSGCLER